VKVPTVWQISSGLRSGPYAETFLRHGVGLVGPGDTGPWRPGESLAAWPHIRLFTSEVQQGDVLLLRSGSSVLQAIGIVASDYLYLNQFDDENGWDLQHARRVRWFRLPEDHCFDGAVFMGPSLGRVVQPEVISYAKRFVNSPPTDWQTASLPPLPPEEADLDEVPAALQEIIAVACDLGGGLYWDGQAFGSPPSESEMVAHLVVPFLRALGWPQEQIAVEWQYVDVALFRALPRSAETCHLIVEAKQVGFGLDEALEQAKAYVQTIGAECDILVTNGIRYRLHARDQGYAPVAYANLCRLKRSATELFARLTRAGRK
jgi:hypothetical protein